MDDFYRENILDHYNNPRNHGHLDHPSAAAEGVNPLCGDELAVELEVHDGVVTDIRYSGRGCAISQAAASMLAREIEGKTLEELKNFQAPQMLDLLRVRLTAARQKCGLLPFKILKTMIYTLEVRKPDTSPRGGAL